MKWDHFLEIHNVKKTEEISLLPVLFLGTTIQKVKVLALKFKVKFDNETIKSTFQHCANELWEDAKKRGAQDAKGLSSGHVNSSFESSMLPDYYVKTSMYF